ncbi:TRAF2 factor, partial [Atractosteus spatula]|nr:TRAF2 factor [Atractosteus spatula]
MARSSSSLPSSLDSNLPGIPQTVLSVPVEPKYLCQACRQVLRKPFQAQCGHRFCIHCLKELTSSGPCPCEACKQEGIFEEPQSLLDTNAAFPDNAARREIENLPASCANEGCTWKGVIKEYESSHEGRCELERVQCAACKALIRRSEQERHSERECEERNLNCKYCKVTFSFKNIKRSCSPVRTEARELGEGRAGVMITSPMILHSILRISCLDWRDGTFQEGRGRGSVAPGPRPTVQGLEQSERLCPGPCSPLTLPSPALAPGPQGTRLSCGKFKAACRFSMVGCSAVLENDKQSEHEQSSAQEHLALLLSAVSGLRQLAALPETDMALGLYRAPEDGPPPKAAAWAGLAQKLGALENIVCAERNALKLEAFARQHRLDQEKIENLTNKVRQMERSVAMKELLLAETEQQLRELEYCTYDGVFIWKITDFTRRRQDAVAGRAPALFSPAFYSSKYGYKMCLRLYLNGDGTGRGTHLSLFFVVMRGKNDALLKWPFSQKSPSLILSPSSPSLSLQVTLMLLDQNNREHIIDAFRPDVTSSSFQRPVSEMNIASGCPLFCPLSKLGGKSSYLRDDTIFIKAIVDLTGL